MLNNSVQNTSEAEYQQIIALMEQLNCSYEQAKRHFQLVNHFDAAKLMQNLQSIINQQHLSNFMNEKQQQQLQIQEQIESNTQIIALTQKQLKTLKEYLNGSLNDKRKKKKKLTCYEKFIQKMKQTKKKLKCLKFLKPNNLCKILRKQRNKNKYNKIQDHSQLNQSAKELIYQQSLDWSLIMDDFLMDQLQDYKIRLEQYLLPRQELVQQIRFISNSGLKVEIKQIIKEKEICPFLLVKENYSEKVETKIKIKAENQFKIICLTEEKFKLIHQKVNGYSDLISCSVCSFNPLGQLQVLTMSNHIAQRDLEDALKLHTGFLIKSKMFHDMLQGKRIFKFINPPQLADQYDYEQESQEGDNRQQFESNKDLIVQQNMLYQSMLHEYVKKKEEQTKKVQESGKKIFNIKEKIREEPPGSTSTYTLIFRLPNGQMKERNFQKTDTLQYLRTWIIAQDEIQFENDDEKNFNLYYDYPPKLISQKQSEPISNIFQQEQNKIKIIIQQI